MAIGAGFRPIVGAHQRSATEVEFLLQLKPYVKWGWKRYP